MWKEKKFRTKGIPNDKYFTFEGKTVAQCPTCKSKLVYDFTDDHLEYVLDEYLGKKKTIYHYCDKCDIELAQNIMVKEVSYTVVMEIETIETNQLNG